MKKVSKAILITLAAGLALVIVLLFGLNLYVQSPGAQARIQEELSKALRLPLKLTNTSISPWSALRITGITIPNGDANFLEAGAFTARYRLLPLLFESELVITEMRVETPKIVWRQNARGEWKLPAPEEAAAIAREEIQSAPETAPAAAPVDPIAKKEKKMKEAKKKNFSVVVNRLEIVDGAVELLDAGGRHVAVCTDVDMTFTALTAERIAGTATIGKAVWADGLTLEAVRTPFQYTALNREASLPEITATLAGGALHGKYRSRQEAEHTPFEAAVTFEHINLDRLMTQTGGEAGQATGEFRGDIEAQGETDRMEKLTGSGRLELRDGQFRQLEFFQNIGQVLGLRELSNLRLKDGQAELRLSGEKVSIERLLLATNDLQISSRKGSIRLDKKVDIDAQLSVEESLVKQLPSIVRDSFLTAENNRRTIDFNVNGTTEKLKTNLLDKLIGQKINTQFGDLISNLFGSDKKPEADKKKKEEEERKKAEKKERKKKEAKDKAAAGAPPEASPVPGLDPAPATSPNP